MDWLQIALFPPGLTSSVITTVWIGVFVVVFFNLRLGWVLSGLVVPGYLVPLLMVKPWSVAVIVAEGILSYAIVWLLSSPGARLGGYTSFFGRDRFFALTLVSVIVRVLSDGWLLPSLAAALESAGYTTFDYRSNLQSFGLVIVALIANQFWKTGLWRGLMPLTVTVGLTYLIVRYLLVPLTNYDVSNVAFMYEDLASSIVASPKAYIILLTTAFVASRMNLVYGWDFSGILLPSLLALQWFQPEVILITFIEALIILSLGRVLLATPLFAQTTIEGGRKLLLFFNIGFAYKFILGYGLLLVAPLHKPTDYFAFGYLLSTLLAIKMHDKDIAIRLTRATVQTSLVAVLLASLLGFGLTLLPLRSDSVAVDTALAEIAELPSRETRPLAEVLRRDKLLLYAGRRASAEPTALDLDRFVEALDRLDSAGMPAPAELAAARRTLAELGYELQIVEQRYLYLREQAARGWGLYVLDTQAVSDLIIESPTAGRQRGVAEAAAALFERYQARGLALAGSIPAIAGERFDPLRNPQTLFAAFHRRLGLRNALQIQVRGRASALVEAAREAPASAATVLWVKSQPPAALDLVDIRGLFGAFDLRLDSPEFANRQREESRAGFAELVMSPQGLTTLLARQSVSIDRLRRTVSERRIEGYLNEWLYSGKTRIAPRASEAYVVPSFEQLLFLDEELLTPLLALIREGYQDGRWSEPALEELRTLAAVADVFDYELIFYTDSSTQQEFLILSEREDYAPSRFWGLYIFRLGAAEDLLVEVPRPLYERGSFEFGQYVASRMNAAVLAIAGAHPEANRDRSSDVILGANQRTLFNLVNQVWLRERERENRSSLLVQIRAFGSRRNRPQARADVLVAPRASIATADAQPRTTALVERLNRDGLDTETVAGDATTAGYEINQQPQAGYAQAAVNTELVSLWLSSETRFGFKAQVENHPQSDQFRALDIPTRDEDVLRLATTAAARRCAIPPALDQAVLAYQQQASIVALRQAQRATGGLQLARLLDRDTQRAFLLVAEPSGRVCALFNLSPRATTTLSGSGRDTLQRFLDTGAARWLPVEPEAP